jgi:hypothetical protein
MRPEAQTNSPSLWQGDWPDSLLIRRRRARDLAIGSRLANRHLITADCSEGACRAWRYMCSLL